MTEILQMAKKNLQIYEKNKIKTNIQEIRHFLQFCKFVGYGQIGKGKFESLNA